MPKKKYHVGIVRDNQDPDKRGRLLIECPEIVSGETLDWVEPMFHFVDSNKSAGCFFVPNVNSQVEVEIEDEEDSEVTSLEPKWRCTVYPEGSIPEVLIEHYPERRGWVTGAGHILYFDDTSDDTVFHYEHPTGAKIRVTNDGDIELFPADGRSVLIGEGADEELVRGAQLKSELDRIQGLYDAHTHTETGTETDPPGTLIGTISSTILSDYHKVK